jgi:hypothetical protein
MTSPSEDVFTRSIFFIPARAARERRLGLE